MLDEDPEEENKDNTNDIEVTNLNEKNTILESKKVSISMHRKKLSQNQLKKFESIFTVEEPSQKSFASEEPMSTHLTNPYEGGHQSPEAKNKTLFKLNLDTENQYRGHTSKFESREDLFSPNNEDN